MFKLFKKEEPKIEPIDDVRLSFTYKFMMNRLFKFELKLLLNQRGYVISKIPLKDSEFYYVLYRRSNKYAPMEFPGIDIDLKNADYVEEVDRKSLPGYPDDIFDCISFVPNYDLWKILLKLGWIDHPDMQAYTYIWYIEGKIPKDEYVEWGFNLMYDSDYNIKQWEEYKQTHQKHNENLGIIKEENLGIFKDKKENKK